MAWWAQALLWPFACSSAVVVAVVAWSLAGRGFLLPSTSTVVAVLAYGAAAVVTATVVLGGLAVGVGLLVRSAAAAVRPGASPAAVVLVLSVVTGVAVLLAVVGALSLGTTIPPSWQATLTAHLPAGGVAGGVAALAAASYGRALLAARSPGPRRDAGGEGARSSRRR